jgi:hypothetical protein
MTGAVLPVEVEPIDTTAPELVAEPAEFVATAV